MMYFGAVIAAIVVFLIGSVWYSVLFRKQWMHAIGIEAEMLDNAKSGLALTMALTLLMEVVIAIILVSLMQMLKIYDWGQVFLLATAVGLIVILASVKNYLYEQRSFTHFLISEGYKFVCIFLAIIILRFFI